MASLFFGCDINCRISPGLVLPHPYGIVIHSAAKLGRDVTILQHVTIGADFGEQTAAVIGDRVILSAGAAVIGSVTVGDDVVVGANAVVTKDVPSGAIVVGANRIVRVCKPEQTQRELVRVNASGN